MTRIPTAFLLISLTLTIGCGGAVAGADAEEEAAPEESAGGEAADTSAADAAHEEAMNEVVQLSMQLGSNRAAFDKNMEKRRPDCERADTLRDRICETSDKICKISEETTDAVPHCERASSKCEKARGDVKDLRCR